MLNQPFGPHGPQWNPTQGPACPNPTSSDPPILLGGGGAPQSWPSSTAPAGGGGGPGWMPMAGDSPGLGCLARPLTVLFLLSGGWSLWLMLYPCTAFTAGMAAFLAAFSLQRLVPSSDPHLGLIVAVVVGLTVLVVLSRTEHRLSRYALYRIPRHVLRLLVLLVCCVREDLGVSVHVLRTALVLRWLGDPTHVAEVACVLLVAHFVLWKSQWMREQWHTGLESIGLRPS